ncbi:TPA: 30S ribosomal protein S8 [bacterium]|jgi:small subunit ribosomal protein S8|nr:30S ribosomal protein S8 [bacterium]
MVMTDPIADMLTRIRNANQMRNETVSMPSSKMKADIARVLQEEGYITSYEITDDNGKKTLTITLKYGINNERVITGIKRISRPGLRVYAPSKKLPKVLNGLGIAIISTSSGLMTNRQAEKANVGGEVIAYVW